MLLGGALLSGCASAETGAARQAAADFQAQVANRDWRAACALLSDEARSRLEGASARPCLRALPALMPSTGSVGEVEVWGGNASVQLGDGALFLSRFAAGWRVIAADCTSRGEDLPYDCSVQG